MLYEHLLYSSGQDVILSRGSFGRPFCNVPVVLHWHAEGRIDWGRRSHDALELALNILHWWIPPNRDPSGTVGVRGVSVSRRVWQAHRDFAVDFIVRMPYEGGTLSVRTAHSWLLERLVFPGGMDDVDKDAGGGPGPRHVR